MTKKPILYFLFALVITMGCKKPYEPGAVTGNNTYLVVDGVINTGANAITMIKLSRSRSLGDSVTISNPELQAQVVIEADAGSLYSLTQQGSDGTYQTGPLNLGTASKYRLKIITHNGSSYVSDFVVAKAAPAIDSVTWKQDKGVKMFVHAHDPQNKTIYYRWDFVETWLYRAANQAMLGVTNRRIFYRDTTTQVYNCWGTENSTNIITASTAALSQDIVSYAPLNFLADSTEKLNIRYSINVKQYALTPEAYQYWEILKKATQETGTMFDPQPSQLPGNIRCTTNPNEPVIGFISATSVAEKRIFIDNNQLINWRYTDPKNSICVQVVALQDPNDYLHYTYFDTTYSPFYFITPGQLAVLKTYCLDCTRRGGTNIKPNFWQ